MNRSILQEKLVALYLRLNGYFTTGLIIHSADDGNVDGEIDIIGVRFKNHHQHDRLIGCSSYLEIPEDCDIDLLIGEVKGQNASLRFNKSVRENNDRRHKLLSWIGLFAVNDLKYLNEELSKAIQPREVNSSEKFERILHKSKMGLISIRPIIFAPDRPLPRNNQLKYINGQVMMDYCWECFRPAVRRVSCETNYAPMSNWGEQFMELVKYFKDQNKKEAGSPAELYSYFNL